MSLSELCTYAGFVHDLQILLQALPCRVATLLQEGRQLHQWET